MKWLGALTFILCSNLVHADGKGLPVSNNPVWKEECGSCHIAFPPQLLSAENWQQLMAGLDKHFGANAAMDAKDAQGILDFLKRNAGSAERFTAPSLKISDTPWFTREHREISSTTWVNPLVKSRSNCTACHIRAEQDDWSERGVKMPAGLHRDDDD